MRTDLLDNLKMHIVGRENRARAATRFFKPGWPKALRIASLCLLLAGVCSPSRAAQVDIGSIQINVFGSFQQILVYNITNLDCTLAGPVPLSCTQANITDWTMTVDYTASAWAQANGYTSPGSNSSSLCGVLGCDTIGPGNDPTPNPQFSLPYVFHNAACCDTIVTEITVTGSLSPSSLTIWDSVNGYGSFFPPPLYTFTFTADLTTDPNAAYYNSLSGTSPDSNFGLVYAADVIISDEGGGGGGGGIPEPATLVLMVGGALALCARRFLGR